jgi:hypothetical protein
MPDIRIQHKGSMGHGSVEPDEMERLQELLRQECAKRFGLDRWPLIPEDFSIYDEPLTGMSTQSHTVIIRITLHNFVSRVTSGDRNASELAAKVSDFLNTERMILWCGRRTVGVSLVFAEVAWSSA